MADIQRAMPMYIEPGKKLQTGRKMSNKKHRKYLEENGVFTASELDALKDRRHRILIKL